jgi:hypothetical protein
MPESRLSTTDFNRAVGDAKKNAAGVTGEISDAAKDLYDQASDSASQVADATSRAARKSAASFEKALRDTVEISLTRRSLSRSASDGCWAECTVRPL